LTDNSDLPRRRCGVLAGHAEETEGLPLRVRSTSAVLPRSPTACPATSPRASRSRNKSDWVGKNCWRAC